MKQRLVLPTVLLAIAGLDGALAEARPRRHTRQDGLTPDGTRSGGLP